MNAPTAPGIVKPVLAAQAGMQEFSPAEIQAEKQRLENERADRLRQIAEQAMEEADRIAAERAAAIEAAKPKGKTFHTRHANSTFIVQLKDKDGKLLVGQTKVYQFHGNSLFLMEGVDSEAIAQISEIADTPACSIYTKSIDPRSLQNEKAPFEEVKSRAMEIIDQIVRSGQRI